MEFSEKKAIVAGHICLDAAPVFPGSRLDLGEVLKPGRLTNTDGIDIHTGGAVANTGLAMKLLGTDVTLIGKVGKDWFGSLVLQILQKYGGDVCRHMIVSEDAATSYSIVLNVPGNDRIFLHDPGANKTFVSADVDFTGSEDAALFHFGYPPIMQRMYERDGAELADLFARARAFGAATSLDMAAVDAESPAGRADWRKILERVLPFVDFFVPSVEELCFMLDRKRHQEWIARAGGRDVTECLDIVRDVEPLAEELFDMGAKIVLIKCGTPGLYYRTGSRSVVGKVGPNAGLDAALWCDRRGFEPSFRPSRVRSATGAGDTSIAAFLTAMLRGRSPERCVSLAAAAGACCVTEYDALSGLLPFEALEQRIDEGWEKTAAGK